jgi:hypothetical protein
MRHSTDPDAIMFPIGGKGEDSPTTILLAHVICIKTARLGSQTSSFG